MPHTLPYRAELDRLSADSAGIDETTAYLPVFRFLRKVAEMTVHVRANYDEAYGGRYNLAADVQVEDDTGKRFALSEEDAQIALTEIRYHDPDAFREIEQRSGKLP